MYYSEDIIEEVISRNNIEDVISEHVRLQKRGSNYVGLCPFHNEKTPSFSVAPSKGMYHCFGCGAGGNVISFIMNYDNASFPEAVQRLAERAGITLPVQSNPEVRKEHSKKARLLEINKEAGKYFYYYLRSPQGQAGADYFDRRQLSKETINKFGLGFAGKKIDGCVSYLREKGFSDQEIVESSLGIFQEKYGVRDKFYNRVMFPIMDMNNHIIGFGGRVMGDGEPKYLNSKETPVFDKGRNLYGINLARKTRNDYFILCEGYMDVITMHQAGFTEAVASLGTAFTQGQAYLVKRFVNTVILSYDSDEAGIKAALRAIEICREAEIAVKILDLKPYKDPDEFIKNLGSDELKNRIAKARNSFFFWIDSIKRKYDLNDPQEKSSFHQEIAKGLSNFSQLERANYLEAVSREYSIDRNALENEIRNYAIKISGIKPKQESPRKESHKEDYIKKTQGLLLTWLYEEPDLYGKIKPYISIEDFSNDFYKNIAQSLFSGLEGGDFNPAKLIAGFEDEEQQKEIASIFNSKLMTLEGLPFDLDNKQDRIRAFKDILVRFKENSNAFRNEINGGDFNKVLERKRELEMIKKLNILL